MENYKLSMLRKTDGGAEWEEIYIEVDDKVIRTTNNELFFETPLNRWIVFEKVQEFICCISHVGDTDINWAENMCQIFIFAPAILQSCFIRIKTV